MEKKKKSKCRGRHPDEAQAARDEVTRRDGWKMEVRILRSLCWHFVIMLTMLTCIRAIEGQCELFWGEKGYMIFNRIPMFWVFDAANVVVIAGLLYFGAIDILNNMRSRDS